jgi:hypothetical protein
MTIQSVNQKIETASFLIRGSIDTKKALIKLLKTILSKNENGF